MLRKILVPLDGSETSIRALDKAIEIAKKFDGKITLVHVYSASFYTKTPDQLYKFIQSARDYGDEILEKGKKKVKLEKIEVEKLLLNGHPVEEILNTANEGNFDLIVIGIKGMSKIKKILVGSVTDRIIKHTPCPVLVVRWYFSISSYRNNDNQYPK